jgi:hypothetical protein
MLEDRDGWDGFVEESPDGMLFHRWDFLKATEKHTGYKLLPLSIRRQGKLICLFPLYYRDFWGFKALLSPPPRACIPYLGPVMLPEFQHLSQIKKEDYSQKVVQGFIDFMVSLSPHYTSVTCVPGLNDARAFQWNQFHITAQYTYEIDIDRPLSEIWENIQPRTRKYIKKHMDHIILHRVRTRDEREKFYRAVEIRYMKQSLMPPLVSPDFLEELSVIFSRSIRLYLIKDDMNEDVLGVWGMINYKDRCITWVGGVSPGKDSAIQHVNESAYWLTMKSAQEEGCSIYEMAGANTPRLCLFKSKLNPRLASYFRAHKKNALGAIGETLYRRALKRRFW